MAAYAIDAAEGRTPSRSAAAAGALLMAGAAALFLGTLFYARLTPELGLPALPAARAQALADALALGPQRLSLAGGFAFAGDCLLLAGCVALAGFSRDGRAGLAAAGWALMAVSVAIALVFDSMMAALLWPLARGSDPAPFLAFKGWFDFLFAAGNVPFGLGFIAVLWADAYGRSPLLPRALAYLGMIVGALAASSGLGYLTDLFHLPLAIGLTVTFGCVILAALGAQIVRQGSVIPEASGR